MATLHRRADREEQESVFVTAADASMIFLLFFGIPTVISTVVSGLMLGWYVGLTCLWIGALLVSTSLLVGHLLECMTPEYDSRRYQDARKRFIVDLAWDRPQSYLFVLVTLLPFGWLAYLVSLIRLNYARRNAEFLPTVWAPATLARQDAVDSSQLRDRTVRKRSKFVSAPQAAREQYRLLRMGAWQQRQAGRRSRLIQEQQEYTRELRDLSQIANLHRTAERGNSEVIAVAQRRAQVLQNALNRVRADLQKIPADDTALQMSQAEVDAEFDRLMALPGVGGVRVVNDEISLLVRARIKYQRKQYDLGDWDIRFGDTGCKLSATEFRSGLIDDKHWGEPAYRLSSGLFCFGYSERIINDNIVKGQFLQAAELAVACLSSVNEHDRSKIPTTFKHARGWQQ